MWEFYWRLIKEAPANFWDSLQTFEGAVMAAAFLVVLLGGERLGKRILNWEGLSRWWALVPISLLFVYSMLQANYNAFEEIRRERDRAQIEMVRPKNTYFRLTQELQSQASRRVRSTLSIAQERYEFRVDTISRDCAKDLSRVANTFRDIFLGAGIDDKQIKVRHGFISRNWNQNITIAFEKDLSIQFVNRLGASLNPFVASDFSIAPQKTSGKPEYIRPDGTKIIHIHITDCPKFTPDGRIHFF